MEESLDEFVLETLEEFPEKSVEGFYLKNPGTKEISQGLSKIMSIC